MNELSSTLTSIRETITREKFVVFFLHLVQQPPQTFVPFACVNSTRIGLTCNVTATSCDILQPCQNSGICNNTNTTSDGYTCSCFTGFNGTQCQYDNRPCKPNTCWNSGNYSLFYSVKQTNKGHVDTFLSLFQVCVMPHSQPHSFVDVPSVGKVFVVKVRLIIVTISLARTLVYVDHRYLVIDVNVPVTVILVNIVRSHREEFSLFSWYQNQLVISPFLLWQVRHCLL